MKNREDAERHRFIDAVANAASSLIADAVEPNESGMGFTLTRELRPDEEYARAVFMAALELLESATQLRQSVALLGSVPCAREAKQAGVPRIPYIVFQIEGHLLRVTGAFDRGLVLVNEVLQLGNPPDNCLRHIIMRNERVRECKAMEPLSKLQSLVDKNRDERDTVAHRKRYSSGGLSLIEALEHTSQSEELQRLSPYKELVTRKYVGTEVDRLTAINGEVASLLDSILTALLPDFVKRHEALARAN